MYWCYFRSRTGKFDISFHVVRACQIYANHGSVQCEHLAFSSLECYNPLNLLDCEFNAARRGEAISGA